MLIYQIDQPMIWNSVSNETRYFFMGGNLKSLVCGNKKKVLSENNTQAELIISSSCYNCVQENMSEKKKKSHLSVLLEFIHIKPHEALLRTVFKSLIENTA